MADKKTFCNHDGAFWRCQSKLWEDQEKGCPIEPMQSKSRGYCIYYCDDARCDNIHAHGEKEE